jgi:hypothetical protein
MTANKKKQAFLDHLRINEEEASWIIQSSYAIFIFQNSATCLPQSNHALLRKSRSMMFDVLHLYNQEIERNKQPEDDEDNDNLDHTMERVNNGNDGDETEKIFATPRCFYLKKVQRMKE